MLLDIGLPGMSGLEVLAEARRIPTPPRVVMMTADDTPETLLKSFRGQAHRFVRKPFAPKRIVDVVNDVLAASAARRCPSRWCRRGRTGWSWWRRARSKSPNACRTS